MKDDAPLKDQLSPQPPLESAVDTTGKTLGPDLRKLNEVKQATGQTLDQPGRGTPDANVNTPRGGPPVER